MEYCHVHWFHNNADEPQAFYCELDNNRCETRKIEIYSDGSFGMAAGGLSFGGAELGCEPVPPVDEINGDTQFMAKVITQQEFEEAWAKYSDFLRRG